MMRLAGLLLSLMMVFSLCACSKEVKEPLDSPVVEEVKEEHLPMPSKESNDKHIAYIKDYVGKNCATVGYTAMNGNRNDYLGEAYLSIVFESADGSYVDIHDDEVLKQYVVVAQSFEPNTEVKIGFRKDENGEEYENLVNYQSIEEIVLQVKKIGEDVVFDHDLVKVNQSADRYTYYIPDFVGRNLLTCGYISWGNDLRFHLGEANCKIIIVTSDGSYVDIDKDVLKNYVVYAQNIEPNSEFIIDYKKDSEGNEYENLVNHQSYDEIDLYVKVVN